MSLVSVIVPVYNTEEVYLKKCIESILNQEFRGFELILVDDGSENQAGEICDYYQQKDKRIKVIHQNNCGVSSARNRGIQKAQGEWLCFIDADDWIEADMFSKIISFPNWETADMVIWNMFINSPEKEKVKKNYSVSKLFEDKDDIKKLQCRLLRTISGKNEWEISNLGFPFCHLYKMQIIKEKGIFFNESLKQGEDKLFNYLYMQHACSILYLNFPLYHYCIHEKSTTKSFFSKHVDNTTRISKIYYEIEPKIQTDKDFYRAYNIRTAYVAWMLIGRYYLHKNNPEKGDVHSFKRLVEQEPYRSAIKNMDLSCLKVSLTKVRLFLLKIHMYQLLFIEEWIKKR